MYVGFFFFLDHHLLRNLSMRMIYVYIYIWQRLDSHLYFLGPYHTGVQLNFEFDLFFHPLFSLLGVEGGLSVVSVIMQALLKKKNALNFRP